MPYLIALAAGLALGCQVVINSKLGAGLGSALWSSLASLQIAAVTLFLIQTASRAPWPYAGSVAAIPLWTWCGGLLGAAYLTGSSSAWAGSARLLQSRLSCSDKWPQLCRLTILDF